MFNVFGLPMHPLVVHATVVVIPVAAVALFLSTVWRRFRVWAGWGVPAVVALAVILDPLTSSSGEALQHSLPPSPLIQRHAQLADGLVPWLLVMLATAVGLYALRLPLVTDRWTPPRLLMIVLSVLALVSAVGGFIWVIIVGHAGATAVWSGRIH